MAGEYAFDRAPEAAQDGSDHRAIAVPTLAFAPMKRAIPGVRLGPAGEAALRLPGSRSEGAEGERLSVLCAPEGQPTLDAQLYLVFEGQIKALLGGR